MKKIILLILIILFSNNLLGFNKKENILKLDIYNLLMNSANANHGLVPNNRKYYWNFSLIISSQ